MPTTYPIFPNYEPFDMAVGNSENMLLGGDIIRLTHDGKRSVMRIFEATPTAGGYRVWATRKQWDRKGRMTQRGKRRGVYFVPLGTEVSVIAYF